MQDFFAGWVIGCLFSGSVVYFTINTYKTDVLKEQAIEHGYADYNSTTGIWQWKD